MYDVAKRPQQDRSRKTLDRYYAAGKRLFAATAVSEVTIPQLVEAAESSVGAFYARFAGKDEYLAAFYRHYFAETRERLMNQLGANQWKGATSEQMVRGVVSQRAEYYISGRKLLANLMTHVRLTNDKRFMEPARALSDDMFARLQSLFAYRRSDLPGAPTADAIRNGFLTAEAGIREFFLFGRGAASASVAPHRGFIKDVGTMLWLLLSQSAEKPA
jgi:AcrR family transcriptional regulator